MPIARLAALASAIVLSAVAHAGEEAKKSPLDYTLTDIDGKKVDLSRYKGKVVMFVNVASRCGNTPQYAGLQQLHEKFADKGLVVIGVPANEFGGQEPGSDQQIKQFCTAEYGVTFPMMSKVVVKGEGIDPLYEHLTSKKTDPTFAGPISWNFEKFLVGRDGQVAARFKPRTKPQTAEVTKAIEKELDAKAGATEEADS